MTHIPMTAPEAVSSFTKKEKRDDVALLPMGTHPAIIYSIVNVGTQDDEYKGESRKRNIVKFTFEFPMHRQLFYKDDTIERPTVLTKQETFVVSQNKKTGKKSNLLAMIEGLEGPLNETQRKNYDISKLLDLKVFVTVAHYQKQNGEIGVKITNIAPFNPMMIAPESVVRTNDTIIYHPGMGFDNIYFAKLQYFDREDVKKSYEGREYAAKGGHFAKFDKDGNIELDDSHPDTPSASAPVGKKVVMLDANNNYNSFKSAGWTDEALVQNGYAMYEVVIPVAAPIPAPLPPTPPQAPPTVASVPTLKMIDTSATYEAFKQSGWTDELLVQHGKAVMITPTPIAVVPPLPVAPPVPIAPQAPAQAFAQTPVAPVQQVAPPTTPTIMPPSAVPPAPELTVFEQTAIPPSAFSDDDAHNDLPF